MTEHDDEGAGAMQFTQRVPVLLVERSVAEPDASDAQRESELLVALSTEN